MNPRHKEPVFDKFLNAIECLLIQNRIFGFLTFSYSKESLHPSKIRNTWNILRILVYLTAITYCIYEILISSKFKPIYKTTEAILLLSNLIYVVTIWFCGVFNSKNIIELLTQMVRFDEKLNQYGIQINYLKRRRCILLQMIGRYIIISVFIVVLVNYMDDYEMKHPLRNILRVILVTISSAVSHLIIELALIIRTRFKILNKKIGSLVKFFMKNNNNIKTINEEVYYEDDKNKFTVQLKQLCNICDMHHQLSKIIQIYNDAFGVVLLFMFAMSFIYIVVAFFYFAANLQASQIRWEHILMCIFSPTPYIIDTVYTCDACYSTIEEVGVVYSNQPYY